MATMHHVKRSFYSIFETDCDIYTKFSMLTETDVLEVSILSKNYFQWNSKWQRLYLEIWNHNSSAMFEVWSGTFMKFNMWTDTGSLEVPLGTSITFDKIQDGNWPPFWKPFLRMRTKFCTALARVCSVQVFSSFVLADCHHFVCK